MPPVVLAIAGSDSCAGAGVQADLKTLMAMGVYGATAITAITAQNTRGVDGVWPVPVESVRAQITAVMADLPVAAIKIGMLGSRALVQAVAACLAEYPDIPVVLDPVMVATSGARLLAPEGEQALREALLPRAALITPNLPEAAALLSREAAASQAEMAAQARELLILGTAAVLVKGGHLSGSEAADILVTDSRGEEVFSSARCNTKNTHGTGCTLASAIAAGLARGLSLSAAVGAAKEFLTGAVVAAQHWELGEGHGPVDHFYQHRRC
ncbi:bifunctional hydroxymethylpyrimidine kinase/phosphomethylpyrimidine kinase [Exilibacterium tricleocarpae]|uniref:hydroxymethylpyrimidine kinase n=2 Tax=Exilibacterium tricleocarpae TaxID=2591008 RepID=A0A545TFB8_9GAMM|nr:bifunctional hydroxymethylpyrimidine kinase/phosphomethylpyrimidine kinase [Exilibacterium tricleocarpae]